MTGCSIDRRTFLRGAGALTLAAGGVGLAGISDGMFERAHADEVAGDKTVVPGLCHSCHVAKCSLHYTVENGVLTGVEGNPDGPWNAGKCCVRGQAAPAFVYNPYRVKKPLKRTNPRKGLDEDPGWVEISYEEATDLIAEKLRAIVEDDPRKLVYMGGFPEFYNQIGGMYGMVAAAVGTPNTGMATGSLCSVHLSNGLVRGGFAQYPDWGTAQYVLAVGGTTAPNIGPGDGGTDYIVDCMQNGTRLVVVDPRCSTEAALGEWQPIRPGTDFAFLLSVEHVILHEENRYDEWFLKHRSTAPYLIGADEDYARDPETNKPLIWDAANKKAVTFDTPVDDYTLEGTFEVNGEQVSTAFTLLKQGVADNTPEWAEVICGISANNIRTITKDLLDNAKIGSTIVLNGQEMPLRPAHVYVSRGLTNHRDGHLAFWVSMVINELLGAIDVPGGNVCAADPNALAPNEDGVVTPEDFHCKMTPWAFPHGMFQAQEFVPYGFDNAQRVLDVIQDPERYQADYIPEMFISAGANYFNKAGDPDFISEGLRKYDFMVSVCYHIDEHALFSDVVIPDTTYIEQAAAYNFDMYRPGHGFLIDGTFGHKHIIDPVFGQQIVDHFWMDVCEKTGILYGPGGLYFLVNVILNLRPDLWLAFDGSEHYTTSDIIDRWLRSHHHDGLTFDEFAKKGVYCERVPDNQAYNYSYWPGDSTRHPLYNVYLVRARKQLFEGMAEAGVQHPGWDDELFEWYYRGVPQWRPTYATEAPEEFDMMGVLWKIPQLIMDMSAPTSNPWAIETARMRPDFGKFVINSKTAAEKGLSEDDEIYAENMDGVVIGPYAVHVSELIAPNCLGVAGGNGHAAGVYSEYSKDNIPYNRLLSNRWDKIDVITGAIDISPRLKITKAS